MVLKSAGSDHASEVNVSVKQRKCLDHPQNPLASKIFCFSSSLPTVYFAQIIFGFFPTELYPRIQMGC